jgi:DNA-binding Lrp family transcriptional regulator
MLTKNEQVILEKLREDSRAPIKDISKSTGIKPSTVYQTINRLKDNGVIRRFTVKLDDRKIQRNFTVFMLITTAQDLEDSFFNNKFIEDVFGVTGEYDLLLKLKFKDVEEFNDFIIGFRKNKTIVKTLTMIGTTKIKEI